MRRGLLALAAALLLGSCDAGEERTGIYLQRFFGECGAVYGNATDVSNVDGECGIITAMINQFNAENSDVRVSQNVVAWPGYPQLTAQMAAGDPPDVVTMHSGVMSDYVAKGLLEPVEPILREAGIDPAAFTDAARRAVTLDGRIYGLPWDTHGGLFHVNICLFEEAGLMRGGEPVLPNSAEELLQHARQFGKRTGKPYLIQSLVADPAYQTRNLYTYMMAHNAPIFPDEDHARLTTPVAGKIMAFWRRIVEERLTTLNQDTPAAIASFMNGGGIYPTGTWMIGQFQQESETAGRPLTIARSTAAVGRGASSAATSGWCRSASAAAKNGRRWRASSASWPSIISTGRGPGICPRSRRSRPPGSRPAGQDIAPLADGQPLPGYVQRQSAIEGLIGEDMAAAVNGQKPVDRALADAERRVNILLAQVD